MLVDSPVGGGPDHSIYADAAEGMRSLLPLLVKFGIATEEEVGIDTLEARFRDEVVGMRGACVSPMAVGAWARKP